MNLEVHIKEAVYCPLCGKPFFGKKYLEKVKDSTMEEPYIYYYKCRKCKSKITIETWSEKSGGY